MNFSKAMEHETRTTGPLTPIHLMTRLTTILFCLCLCSVVSTAQVIRGAQEHSGTFSGDTALVNHLIGITLPLTFSSATQDSAKVNLDRIFSLSDYRRYYKGLAEYYRLLVVIYYTRQAGDSVSWGLDKEFYWASRSGDPGELAKAYDLKAWLFQNANEIDSAANYYILTLHITDSLKDRKFSAEIYNNLSILFFEIGDSLKAGEYAKKTYQAARLLNDSMLIVNGLLNLANSKSNLKEVDTALLLFEQIRAMVHDPLKYNAALIRTLCNEASLLTDQHKNPEAISKFKSLLAIKTQIAPDLLPYVYNGLAVALYGEKRYREAAANIDSALDILETNKRENSKLALSDSYKYMSMVLEGQKKFSGALFFKKKYDSLNNIITGEATRKNLHLLEIKYNLAQKNKRIAEQNLDLAQKQQAIQKKNVLMLIIFGGLLALVLIFLLSLRSYRQKRELDRQSILTLQKQHEVETLKAKMDAREEERNRIGREMHDDIGSALTTILYLSDEMKSQTSGHTALTAGRISGTAESVVDKMNEIIWSMNTEYDTLDDLIAYARQHAVEFLENNGMEYQFEAPDDIPDARLAGEQRRNIYLTMKEALHNTVKHAGATRVQIVFSLGDGLNVSIRDNGRGITPDESRRFGNGLRNMEQRMESVGGSFRILNDQGTTILLHCPVDIPVA